MYPPTKSKSITHALQHVHTIWLNAVICVCVQVSEWVIGGWVGGRVSGCVGRWVSARENPDFDFDSLVTHCIVLIVEPVWGAHTTLRSIWEHETIQHHSRIHSHTHCINSFEQSHAFTLTHSRTISYYLALTLPRTHTQSLAPCTLTRPVYNNKESSRPECACIPPRTPVVANVNKLNKQIKT